MTIRAKTRKNGIDYEINAKCDNRGYASKFTMRDLTHGGKTRGNLEYRVNFQEWLRIENHQILRFW